MKLLRMLPALSCFVAVSTPSLAQECESIISLSKVQSVVVSDQATVSQHAANFCNEYSKSSGKSSSTNAGASYKFLSASFGQSGASTEQVASRYCSADQSYQAAKEAYKQYVESISPNAYSAYSQCIAMSQKSLRYNIDPGSILPNEFTLSVSFASDVVDSTKAMLAYSTPDGVTCAWDGTEEKSATVTSGSTEILKCSRQDAGKRSYVTVVRKDGGNTPMTLSWPAYNAEGFPVNQVAQLESDITALTSRAETLESTIQSLQSENIAMKADFATQIAKRKMTWVRANETCPEGSQHLGSIGVIMLNTQYQNNLGGGAAYNAGWTWTHPQLCWFP